MPYNPNRVVFYGANGTWIDNALPPPLSITSSESINLLSSFERLAKTSLGASLLNRATVDGDLRVTGTASVNSPAFGASVALGAARPTIYVNYANSMNVYWFNNHGTIVNGDVDLVIAHELSHAVRNTMDPLVSDTTTPGGFRSPTDAEMNVGSFDFRGDAVRDQNRIASQLGLSDQVRVSYGAAFYPNASNSFRLGASYTHNQQINVARLGSDDNNIQDHRDRLDNSDDLIFGLGGDDRVYGGGGNDHLYGGDGDDRISGGRGNDRIYGEAGNDTLVGNVGSDLLVGGFNTDVSSSAVSTDGYDTVDYRSFSIGASGDGIIISLSNEPIDALYSDFADFSRAVFVADRARDRAVDTLISIERINATTGDDVLAIRSLAPELLADTVSLQGGLATIALGQQKIADLIDLSGIDGAIVAQLVDELIWLETSEVQRLRVTGAEQLLGSRFDDTITGGRAGEALAGGNGNDLIYGGGGRDFIFGGAGVDRLYGDGGNDKIVVGNNGHIDGTGGTFVDGGAGNDTIFILRAAERPSSDSAATTTLANAATITLANGDAGDRIVWNGHELTGGTFKVIVNPNADGDGVGLIIPIADYVGALGEIYSWRPGQQTLTINLPDMTMLSIAFDNGDYGLTFAAPPANEFAPSVPRSAAASLPNTATIFERLDAIEGRHAAFDSVGETNAPRAPQPGQAGAQPADNSATAAAFMLDSDEAALFSSTAFNYYPPAHDLTDMTSLAA